MKTQQASEVVSRLHNPNSRASKRQTVEEACTAALSKCGNFWVRESIQSGKIFVQVNRGIIFICGTSDSTIAANDAERCLVSWAKRAKIKMDVKDRTHVKSRSNGTTEKFHPQRRYNFEGLSHLHTEVDSAVIDINNVDEEMQSISDQ